MQQQVGFGHLRPPPKGGLTGNPFQNDGTPPQGIPTTASSRTIHLGGRSHTSLARTSLLLPHVHPVEDAGKPRREPSYCVSKTDIRVYSRSREPLQSPSRVLRRHSPTSRDRVFSSPDFVVSDCWKTSSREIPGNLIQLFRERYQEVEEDEEVPVKKQKLDSDENEMLSYTKEFHVLSEVQKERILTVVEDTVKKLADKDVNDIGQEFLEPPRVSPPPMEYISKERFFCKKFLLPWVIVKVVELVLCHLIQLTFLSQDTYFQRENEFLPIVVTYYLTLFIIIVSLVIHTSCFSCGGMSNPCYFMGAISSSILTLTTTLGILVMLTSIEYYKTLREMLVLALIGALLLSLFVELCICYLEVKTIWRGVAQSELYCVE